MRKTLLSGIVAASLLTPTIGHAQAPNAGKSTVDVSAAIEIQRWTLLGTLAVVGYFVLGVPTTQAVGYLAGGAIAGYMMRDSNQRQTDLRKH